MATYEVTGPDGHRYRVTGPDGASDAEVLAQVHAAAPAPNTAEATTIPQALAIGAGQGFDRLAAGLRQITPEPIRNGLDALNNALGMGDNPSVDPMAQAANSAAVAPVAADHPYASGFGESLPMMAGGPFSMPALAGLSYGTPMDRAKNAAGAAVGGALGAGVGKVASIIAQPLKAPISAFAQKTGDILEQYGMRALPSQVTGSAPVAWLQSVLAKYPGGSPLRAAAADQQQALNAATMNAMGGAGDMVTPEAVKAAQQTVGKQFETIPQGQTVALDDQFQSKLQDVAQRYSKRLSADQKQVVGSYLDDIAQAGPTIPGPVYQQWRSDIAQRAASTQDSATKAALTGVYKALDDAFNRSATGTAAADYAKARAQYNVLKNVGGLANPSGDVSAARLATAAKNLPGAGGDLASLGQAMKGLPDSGTAQRLMYQGLLSGLVGTGAGVATGDPRQGLEYAAGSFALPYAASKFLASDTGRAWLTKGLLSVSPEVERRLLQATSLTGGLLGQRFVQ